MQGPAPGGFGVDRGDLCYMAMLPDDVHRLSCMLGNELAYNPRHTSLLQLKIDPPLSRPSTDWLTPLMGRKTFLK